MEKQLVTLYCAHFNGLFDRKRKNSFTTTDPCRSQADAIKSLRERHTLKKGKLEVVKYDNCEVLDGGLFVIPITQGVRIHTETVGA